MFALLGMKGPYELNESTVNTILEAERMGNYALGEMDKNDEFVPRKIGRSDIDLQKDVLAWVTFHRYTHFAYTYATTAKQTFEKECNNYHDLFQFLNNPPHPKPPQGYAYKCPNKWCDR